MGRPVPGSNFLGDQLVPGCSIRHAEQRLGQTHEGKALLIREAKLFEEAFHHALLAGHGTGCFHDVAAQADGFCTLMIGQGCRIKKIAYKRLLISKFQPVQLIPAGRNVRSIRHQSTPFAP